MKFTVILSWLLTYISNNSIKAVGNLVNIAPGTVKPYIRSIGSRTVEVESKAVKLQGFLLPVDDFQWRRQLRHLLYAGDSCLRNCFTQIIRAGTGIKPGPDCKRNKD